MTDSVSTASATYQPTRIPACDICHVYQADYVRWFYDPFFYGQLRKGWVCAICERKCPW